MNLIHKLLIFLGIPLMGLLVAGCASKEVLDSKMEAIAGEYVMESLEGHYPVCPPDLYEKIKIARIQRGRNGWNLDFDFPAHYSGDTYDSYRHFTFEVYWNQIFGKYMVSSRDWSELDNSGLSRSDINYLDVTPTDLTIGSFRWIKQ